MDRDEESIFEEALQRKNPAERSAYLEDVCRENTQLHLRITSLLDSFDAGEFLEQVPNEIDESISAPIEGSMTGSRVGPYTVLELLGEGGMGEVYLAGREDGQLPAQVALKVIRLGMDSHQVIARFQMEQKILKRLDHPNIAKLIDAGVTESGRAYFAMELIQGIPITQFCDREQLTLGQRVELLVQACRAIQHAHERGIVHRDLKPSNVLVSMQTRQPVVKVIDFGVAKALEAGLAGGGLHTRATQIVGTLGYMSPEQASWSSDVDWRTDVYSLGVLLYELLTGSIPSRREPGSGGNSQTTQRFIDNPDTLRPSHRIAKLTPEELEHVCSTRLTQRHRLIRETRDDLDWIALKALETNREDRYATPAALANDLDACLQHRPVLARSPSWASRSRKWVRRHRGKLQIAGSLTLIVLCVAGFAFDYQKIRDTQREQQETRSALSQVESDRLQISFDRDIKAVSSLLSSGDNQSAIKLLEGYRGTATSKFSENFATRYLRTQISVPLHVFHGHLNDILDMDVSPDQHWIASSDRGGEVIIWDHFERKLHFRIHTSDLEVTRVRFSPDGQWLATAGQDRMVRLWSVGDWKPVAILEKHQLTINGLDWSPDSQRLASSDRDGAVCVWNTHTRLCEHELPQHSAVVRTLAWSPDGTRLATANGEQGVNIWDSRTWQKTASVLREGVAPLTISFSRDSRFVAFAGYNSGIVVADLETNNVVQNISARTTIWSLTFGSHNELIAGLGSGYLQVLQHSPSDGQWHAVRLADVGCRDSSLRSTKCLQDSNLLLIASEQQRKVLIFSASSVLGYQRKAFPSIPIGVVPTLNWIVSASDDLGQVTLRELVTGELVSQLALSISKTCLPQYDPNNHVLAIANDDADDCGVTVFNPETWETLSRLKTDTPAQSLSFSWDGSELAVVEREGTIQIWNLKTKRISRLRRNAGNERAFVKFSPASDLLVVSCKNGHEMVGLHPDTEKQIGKFESSYPILAPTFHPDGDFFVVGELDRILVWSGEMWDLQWSRAASEDLGQIKAVCISPDKITIAVLNERGNVQFWNAQTHSEMFSVQLPVRGNGWMAFTDRDTLIVGSENESSIFSLGAGAVGTAKP